MCVSSSGSEQVSVSKLGPPRASSAQVIEWTLDQLKSAPPPPPHPPPIHLRISAPWCIASLTLSLSLSQSQIQIQFSCPPPPADAAADALVCLLASRPWPQISHLLVLCHTHNTTQSINLLMLLLLLLSVLACNGPI